METQLTAEAAADIDKLLITDPTLNLKDQADLAVDSTANFASGSQGQKERLANINKLRWLHSLFYQMS